MRTLVRSVGKQDIGGEPIPTVFTTLAVNNIVIRRAEVSLIAGTPGAGKSTLALAFALRANVPTLYVSADTNLHTMAMRMYSMVTGVTQTDAEQTMEQEPEAFKQKLDCTQHIYWVFDSAPDLENLYQNVLAFEELWGESPSMIVVDNLMDVAMDGAEEWSGMRSAMKELKFLARETNAAVVVLHHTKETYEGTPCQPRAAIQGMVNQLPALILTIGQDPNGGYLGVASVKNRYGKADPTGKIVHMLEFQPERMFIADPERAVI